MLVSICFISALQFIIGVFGVGSVKIRQMVDSNLNEPVMNFDFIKEVFDLLAYTFEAFLKM